MLDTAIVVGIVVIVVFLSGRSLYRTMTGKSGGCSCAGGCPGCASREMADIQAKKVP